MIEDTHIIKLKIKKNKGTLVQLLHFFIKYINERKKTYNKNMNLNKIMSIQSKDSHVCQKSLPLDLETTLLTLIFSRS